MRRRPTMYFENGAWYHPGPKPYGCLPFLFDLFMTVITGGLWLIWIFVREMRSR